MFSSEICETFKNTYFYRTLPVTTFETKQNQTYSCLAANLLQISIENLYWNESHEEENKYIHASATDLLH